MYKPVGGPSVDEAEKVIERLQQGSNSRHSGCHLGLTSRLNRLTVGHREGGDAGSKPAKGFLLLSLGYFWIP